MPLVNQSWLNVKIGQNHPKTTIFMFLHQTWAYRRFLSTLTWDWLPRMIKKPNFDLTIRMGGNQCHCKGYWIPFPTTIHVSKSELKMLKYHENCVGHISSLPKAITFFDHWIFELSSVLETNIHTFPLVSRLAQSKVEKAFK